MAAYLGNFVSRPGQIVALAAVAVVWLGLSAIGGVLAGRERFREADFLCGWAGVCILFILSGVFTPLRFTPLAIATGLAAIAAAAIAWRREGSLLPAGALRMVILVLPLLLLVSGMTASQWDEFSHWLASGNFLLHADHFPNAAHPQTGAVYPAYPYGWPLIAYFVGRIAGHLVEAAGPLVNVLLLLSFGLLVIRLIGHALGNDALPARPGWALCGLGAMAVTLANPTFVQKVVLTNYADTSCAVSLGFATVLAWFMLEAQAEGRLAEARRLAWQAGLALAVLVSLKQSTLAPAGLLVGAVGAVALRHPGIRLRDGMRLLIWLVLPPLVVYLAWRYYVATELSGREFVIRPLSEWAFGLLPAILRSMAVVALSKGLYFGIMVIATGFGVRGWFRMRTPFDRLAVLAGALFLGYNAFLLFAYVTAFSSEGAIHAVSFWRYHMHLGMVCVAFAAYGLAHLWKTRWIGRFDIRRLAWIPMVAVIAAPFIFASKLRFDREPPVPFFRSVAADLRGLVPKGASVVVVDPTGNGESQMIAHYEGYGRYTASRFVSAFTDPTTKNIAATIDRSPNSAFALVLSVTPAVRQVLGPQLAADTAYLLHREAGTGTWAVIHAWPEKEAR